MKICSLLLTITTALLFVGCDFEQLSIEKHGNKIASIIGVDESELQFLSFTDFVAILESVEKEVYAYRGVTSLVGY